MKININKNKFKSNINCLIFCLIINMQSLSIWFWWNSIYTFLIMLVFILFNYKILFSSISKIKQKDFISIIGILFIVGLIFVESIYFNNIIDSFKVVILIIAAIVTLFLDWTVILKGINLSLIYNIIYSIVVMILNETIKRGFIIQAGESIRYTYITVTFTIGLSLTIVLVRLLVNRKSLKDYVNLIISSVIYLIAILQYNARGNLIFPFLVFVILLLYSFSYDGKTILKTFFFLGVCIILISYGYNSLIDNTLFMRIIDLASGNDSGRLEIWKYYLSEGISGIYKIVGIGFKQSPKILKVLGGGNAYPHNFIIEAYGELGIVGLIIIFEKLIYTPIREVIKQRVKNTHNNILVFTIIASYMYICFSYLKSGSLYDAYLLFIFSALLGVKMKKRRYIQSNDVNRCK